MTDTRLSSAAALVVYAGAPIVRMSTVAGLAVYKGPAARITRASTVAALVVYANPPNAIPRVSTAAALVVWGDQIGDENRTRAWVYTLDGHTFYVLDLGQEGTFLYDLTTQQWCQYVTEGHDGWNVRAGVMWGEDNRIVGGDGYHGVVWEVDPDTFDDEDGLVEIEHTVTGGIMTRSRVFHSVEELRVAGSLGLFTSPETAEIRLRISDDNGENYTDMGTIPVDPNVPLEAVWRSLGSFMAPGRIFEISDIGGMFRIDGADVYIGDFDEDGS